MREIHHACDGPGVGEMAPHPQATDREAPGNYRQHDIHPFPAGMEPVSWPLVAGELSSWRRPGQLDRPELSPMFPEALAAVHCRFEQIHPFLDGNGRTGRLVLNLILVRLGYPPVVIYKRDRARYLRALRRADDGVVAPLGDDARPSDPRQPLPLSCCPP